MKQTILSTFTKEDAKSASLVFWYKTEHVATGTKIRVAECRTCGIYTYILPYCAACSVKRGLVVKPSSIPEAGLGVFACKRGTSENELVFRRGTRICSYGTEENRIVLGNAVSRYGTLSTQPYTYQTEDGKYYDSADYRTIGAIINDSKGSGIPCNARFSEKGYEVCVVAVKDIYAGQELFISYGDEYWGSISMCKYTTSVERPSWCTFS